MKFIKQSKNKQKKFNNEYNVPWYVIKLNELRAKVQNYFSLFILNVSLQEFT